MIRTALLATALACFGLTANAAAAGLTIHVQGVRAQTGTVRVALVNSAEGWNGKAAPVKAAQAHPAGDQLQFAFDDLPAGEYAVLLTHDENDNGKLDTNLVGMPVEGYGFSNNPNVMRKPTFDEARFSVPAAGTAINITLR